MKILVKILSGPEYSVEVPQNETVFSIKEAVGVLSGTPPDQQRLVLKGKALQDNTPIQDSGIIDGCKLFLTIKKSNTSSGPANSDVKKREDTTSEASSASQTLPKTYNDKFWNELLIFLKKHFSPNDAKIVLEKFKENHYEMISNLSLDDIERIADNSLEGR